MLLCLNPVYLPSKAMSVDCGHCRACRLKRTNEWSLRLKHQGSTINHNVLIVTLTYDSNHVPYGYTLRPDHLQDFHKRLRINIDRGYYVTLEGKRVYHNLPKIKYKYYASGEYGERYGRPHYHLAIFGLDMRYKRIIWESWRMCDYNYGYDCELIRDPDKGYRYVAGYCRKKLGKGYSREYAKRCKRHPEFGRQSQGLGYAWLLDYVAKNPFAHTLRDNGAEILLPRYYRKKLKMPYTYIEDYINEKLENYHHKICGFKNLGKSYQDIDREIREKIDKYLRDAQEKFKSRERAL